jgi:hypothetical protein
VRGKQLGGAGLFVPTGGVIGGASSIISVDAIRNDRRVGLPPSGVWYPIWALLQYDSTLIFRPDLRRVGHLPTGSKGVLVEFHASEENVFLSDFDLWHYVLNRWYLPHTSSEVLDLESTRPVTSEHRLTRSWEAVFDLDWNLKGVTIPRSERSIQATVWQVPLSSVRSVRTFRAR